ncbi:SIMPL domain-containing protein [Desulfoprunum benzoelyticum]|uniref:Periplasmic immunogenic protein n=1 Tax=Desulfoprunum benzoelyticum TaxID=1506996 RepID=A0A840USR3_9BACT|nr:SIMPL domain-containing protein [Desulfoprunum benzoelyticum]MBB5349247.1 hypothetical protein [Desulfoprunum benzoelyticum]MBM9530822.1 SIMPL domain-containing protein [Desulfoprunum benzoelyticum]
MKNQQWGVVLAAIIVCAAIVFAADRLQQTGIRIEDRSEPVVEKKTEAIPVTQRTITVTGEGRIVVEPDHVRITAGVSELAETTGKAQQQANQKLTRVLDILKENEIPERNIQTSHLAFRPEYDWSDGERRLIGQRVEQSLNIDIPEIDVRPDRVAKILDTFGAIHQLEMHSVSFEVKNRKELVNRARVLAFEEARQKAEALAQLSGLAVEKPLQISENEGNARPIPYFRTTPQMHAAVEGAPSALPAGEMDVTVMVNVVFAVR